jgi:5-methylcytosine-specific restriction endonuclease McrA
MTGEPPANLEVIDPGARTFPPSWRDAAIRALYDPQRSGVVCPGCGQLFHGRRDLSLLHADHIIAWSRGGQTLWSNLQILCRPCNLAKQDNSW